MNLIKFLKGFLFFLFPFIGLLLIITLFYYFDLLSNQLIKYFKIIILLLSCIISGIYIGKNSLNKGYLNGIKFSFLIVLLFLIITLICKNFKWYNLVYYLIIIITITIGSMIGINYKERK